MILLLTEQQYTAVQQIEFRKLREESMRRTFNIPEDVNTIQVFHGTSEKNARNIIKTGLRKHSWLTTDESEAQMYSKIQGHRGKPYVMSLKVYIGSCLPNSDKYITTEEVLYPRGNGFFPKDYLY